MNLKLEQPGTLQLENVDNRLEVVACLDEEDVQLISTAANERWDDDLDPIYVHAGRDLLDLVREALEMHCSREGHIDHEAVKIMRAAFISAVAICDEALLLPALPQF